MFCPVLTILAKLKDKRWSKEIPEYDIEIDEVKFKDLTKEQYELLYRLKGST